LINKVREQGISVKEAAAQQGISCSTAYKWLERYKESGEAVLEEPELAASAQPQAVVSSPAIAFTLPLPLPPVTNELRRLGVNKISRLEFGPSVERYEHNRPGETIHLDIKKLGRIGVVGHRITGERSQRKCKPLRRPPLPPVPCSGSQAGLKGMA